MWCDPPPLCVRVPTPLCPLRRHFQPLLLSLFFSSRVTRHRAVAQERPATSIPRVVPWMRAAALALTARAAATTTTTTTEGATRATTMTTRLVGEETTLVLVPEQVVRSA